MTRLQEVREEQVNFLKNNPDPCPLNFFIVFKYRRRLSAYNDYLLRLNKALQEDPTSEKLLDLKRSYDNSNYKKDWTQYKDWKKNREANVPHVSFHEQLDDELVGEESSKTGRDFDNNDDSLVFRDSDSDEELTSTLEKDTLGYDGLAFLFNDLNEVAIMGKIDENTLEEESKLPLASDNKDSSTFICEDVLNAFRRYQNKISKSRKVFTPAYWGVLDLTRESLYECKEITENNLQQLSQDFANHVKWKCEPAPINIQNYFDSRCEKLDNSDENKYFDTNIQFLKINMHSFQGMLTEEQLKMTSSFPLFNGIFTSNRIKHSWGEIHSLSNSDARNEKSNPYKKSRMRRKVDMKVTLLKTPNKFEALFGEVAGGLGPFGVPTACRKKRFLDKLKLMIIMRDSINRLLKECDHVSDDEKLKVIVYGWLQFGLELNFYAMDWRGSGVYRFGLLDRCMIPVDDNYCNILEDAYCILKLLE
ncbi:4012_t:CDS:2, partial [Cetraspora pellucida]